MYSSFILLISTKTYKTSILFYSIFGKLQFYFWETSWRPLQVFPSLSILDRTFWGTSPEFAVSLNNSTSRISVRNFFSTVNFQDLQFTSSFESFKRTFQICTAFYFWTLGCRDIDFYIFSCVPSKQEDLSRYQPIFFENSYLKNYLLDFLHSWFIGKRILSSFRFFDWFWLVWSSSRVISFPISKFHFGLQLPLIPIGVLFSCF